MKRNDIKRYTFEDIVGDDENFRQLVAKAKRIAKNPYSVLILGETGTGKEMFAQSIHYASSRREKPFLAQNCAAFPAGLLESILFGTVKGSFTGAVDRAGLFEQASGGTLLLDEISAMPYEFQSKLLRVLQENYIRRVGDTTDIPIDVRIIATSNEPLELLVERGVFRQDLYYRLNIITIEMIPLRERKDDIMLLADSFLRKHGRSKEIRISEKAKQKLLSYDYCGNVRELENTIMSAMALMEEDDELLEEHIVFPPHPEELQEENCYELHGASLPEKMQEIETKIIKNVMRKNDGNISGAARELGVKRQTLQYKLRGMTNEDAKKTAKTADFSAG